MLAMVVVLARTTEGAALKRCLIISSLFAFALVAPLGLVGDEGAAQATPSVNYPPRFFPKTLKLSDGSEWKYVVYLPPQYDNAPEHKWPVILFLHGSGEVGTDNVRHTNIGLPRYIREHPDSFPFVVVMPQVPTRWFRGRNGAAVLSILDSVMNEYSTDRDRVYLTGLSMGGFGAWEIACIQPDLFAAVVPVCGMAPNDFLSNITHMPVWAFHGEDDPNVPVAGSRQAVAELRKHGAAPKYTEYPKGGHKIWDRAYGKKSLYRWLLEQRRENAPKKIDYRIAGPLARVWWLTVRPEKGAVGKARIRAEISDDKTITLETQDVAAWSITCEERPLKIGEPIKVVLNGALIYEGPFSGSMGYGWKLDDADPAGPATKPASTPAP